MSGVETIYPGASLESGGGGGPGDVVGPASSLDGELVLFDGTTGALLKGGGVPPVYLGAMTWAALQASSYANGSVGLAALNADASVFITDIAFGVALIPNAAKTFWTSPHPIVLDNFSSAATGTDIVYTGSGTTVTAVASASAGAKTRCTSTAHGLTSANNGVAVYVTGGTNWAVGFYPYTYVDANTYDLDIAWNAAFGNPTVRSVTGSALQTPLRTVTLQAGLMQASSLLLEQSQWQFTNSAGAKYMTTLLGGTGGTSILQATYPSATTAVDHLRPTRNRALKTAQISPQTNLTVDGGSGIRTSSIDTSAAVDFVYAADMRTVNEFMRLSGALLMLVIGQ